MSIRMAALSAIVILAAGLGGCATGRRAPSPYLTPAEQQLRNEVETERNLEGAALGCLGGAILGALIDENNRERGAAIGCGAGAVTGYVASEYVNARNAEYADAQAYARAREEGAQRAAARYRQATATARALVADEKRKIAALNAQYRARQITAEQYKSQVASAAENIQLLNRQIGQIDDTIAQIDRDNSAAGSTSTGMRKRRDELTTERDRLRRAVTELSELYSREIPAEVGTKA